MDEDKEQAQYAFDQLLLRIQALEQRASDLESRLAVLDQFSVVTPPTA